MVPRGSVFLDDYSFGAYEAAGFGVVGDDEEASKAAAKEVNFMLSRDVRVWISALKKSKILPGLHPPLATTRK